jgi:copper chaperone CopZ
MAKLEIFRMKVVGEKTIHCSGCENTVRMGLSKLPGVKKVEADHKTQLVEVSADVEQTSHEVIRKHLGGMGYEVVPQ